MVILGPRSPCYNPCKIRALLPSLSHKKGFFAMVLKELTKSGNNFEVGEHLL